MGNRVAIMTGWVGDILNSISLPELVLLVHLLKGSLLLRSELAPFGYGPLHGDLV